MARPRTLHIIDGSAQFHRAYHAIRGLTTSRGLPTNATYGFTTMLRKLLEDEQPEWIVISFDLPGKTFRHEKYAEYKANRPKMADDLAVQISYVRRVCEALRVPIIELQKYEADDVIATLARQAVEQGFRVVIITADKDLLQLVTDQVLVLNPGRDGSGAKLYDRAGVEDKFGVPPEKVLDVMSLVGDAVDNVPGVPGIGDKGARTLIQEFGSLEAVLAGADQIKRKAYREGLKEHREQALLSRDLIRLRDDAPVTLDLDLVERREPDREAAHALFTELEFQVIAREFAPEVSETATLVSVASSVAEVEALVARVRESGRAALRVVATQGHPLDAKLLGIAVSTKQGEASYVPLGHAYLGGPSEGEQAQALGALAPILADPGISKLSADAKRDHIILAGSGVEPAGLAFDALIAAYLLDPGKRDYNLEDLSLELLGERRSVTGHADTSVSVDNAAQAAGAEADLVLRLAGKMLERVELEGLHAVFEGMELPLVEVLAAMERAGVKLDVGLLATMSGEMGERLEALTVDIYELAGGEFNINSPPQLREVLFDRLGLKSGKRTAKTRAASTAEDVLEELAKTHDLPRRILEYRSIKKLKSTYVDALPVLVRQDTGRIHASMRQTVAATGRISSSDPNLQNIPIRTAEGRRIREAFIAEPGYLLLSADYSQIELRILAHLSGDETLLDTFRKGEDVHDRTSREIFGPLSMIPPDEQRRVSKMVNYALIYGKTAFTLAKDLGVSRKEADTFIKAYFARYPGVDSFIKETIEKAREEGSVRTLLGRLRRLPDLRSRNFQVRAEAERQAVNAPVQGSAADLIKRAMIDLVKELREGGYDARLILQIHDELLVEVAESDTEAVRDVTTRVMEGALELRVPLVVDARVGRTWAEAH